MKTIVVSQRVDAHPERTETRDSLDQRLISFLLMAGCLPVPVPNVLYMEERSHKAFITWLASVAPKGIVLSGGNDIGQYVTRDFTEASLLDYAHEQQLPLLGICRGMQMMAHWAGTGLHRVEGHVRTRHRLFGQIVGDVNSYHAYSLENCPNGFKVLTRSEDDEIEAICHHSLRWEGWMWHPEREDNFSSQDVQRAKTLLGE